jgi:pSer/pThr/pTyr-binding forkhead associated (FHA) protein
MEEYLELTFDIFDEAGQRASVRSSIIVAELISEIVSEFEGLESDGQTTYALSIAGSASSLDPQRTLLEQGVQPGDRIIFGWAQKAQGSPRRPISQPGSAALQEMSSGKFFPISWQPACIGRPDSDLAHNELLAVNLEWLPGGARVSRSHAQVHEQSGFFFLEGLSSQNPTLLNGNPLPLGQAVRLDHDDRIDLGLSGISLRFVMKGKGK